MAALKGAPTVVDLVLDEPDNFSEGVGRPAAPALDGVWGRGTLRGFRCNREGDMSRLDASEFLLSEWRVDLIIEIYKQVRV